MKFRNSWRLALAFELDDQEEAATVVSMLTGIIEAMHKRLEGDRLFDLGEIAEQYLGEYVSSGRQTKGYDVVPDPKRTRPDQKVSIRIADISGRALDPGVTVIREKMQ